MGLGRRCMVTQASIEGRRAVGNNASLGPYMGVEQIYWKSISRQDLSEATKYTYFLLRILNNSVMFFLPRMPLASSTDSDPPKVPPPPPPPPPFSHLETPQVKPPTLKFLVVLEATEHCR